mgnify:CR=1 FL=1
MPFLHVWIRYIRMSPGVSYYRNLKIKRTFPNGKHAKLVALLENGTVVKKSYHQQHQNIFEYEVSALRKLQPVKFVPRLLCVDEEKRTFYISYVGRLLTNFGPYQAKINKYKQIMQEEYGVYHNDIREGNVCLHRGQIYFIDFGWSRDFPGIGGYGVGRIGHNQRRSESESENSDHQNHRTTRQELLNLLLSIYASEELKSEWLRSRIMDILAHEQMLPQVKETHTEKAKIEDISSDISSS